MRSCCLNGLCALHLAERHPHRRPDHSTVHVGSSLAFFANCGDQSHVVAAARHVIGART